MQVEVTLKGISSAKLQYRPVFLGRPMHAHGRPCALLAIAIHTAGPNPSTSWNTSARSICSHSAYVRTSAPAYTSRHSHLSLAFFRSTVRESTVAYTWWPLWQYSTNSESKSDQFGHVLLKNGRHFFLYSGRKNEVDVFKPLADLQTPCKSQLFNFMHQTKNIRKVQYSWDL